MAVKTVPYCEIAKYEPSLEGVVWNHGFAFNERPAEQITNPEYSFTNFICEPNTNTLMTKPYLSRMYAPGDQAWTENIGVDWKSDWTLFPDVRVMFWTNTQLGATFKITSPSALLENEAFCIEYNKLNSNNNAEDNSYIYITFGDGDYRIRITRTDFALDIKHDGNWNPHALPFVTSKGFSQQYSSKYIYVIPYIGGILISDNLQDYIFVKEDDTLTVDAGNVVIEGNCGVSYFALHKVRFNNASMTSGQIYSYQPQLNENSEPIVPYFQVGVSPLGTSITKSVSVDANGQDMTYSISVNASTYPIAILGISISFPVQIIRDVLNSTLIKDVISYDETTGGSADELNARIVIDNTIPHPYTGYFRQYDKLQCWIGWQQTELGNGGEVINTFTTPFLRNILTIKDIEDTREQSNSFITLNCSSYLQNVIDGMNVITPDYNGWLVTDVLTDLLNRAGIPSDRISISDAWATERLEATEENDTWLPKEGDRLWDTLKKIVEELLGGWVIQYPNGIIRIEPYPEIEDVDWETVTNTFYIDTDIENISFKSPEQNMDSFYNIVSVWGLGKNETPIGVTLIDNDSIYNPSSDKFIGYVRHLRIIDGVYNTQAICEDICRKVFKRLNKFRNYINFTTNVKSGNELLYQGNSIVLEYSDGAKLGVMVRNISTSVAHNHLQQTIEGEWVIVPEPEP